MRALTMIGAACAGLLSVLPAAAQTICYDDGACFHASRQVVLPYEEEYDLRGYAIPPRVVVDEAPVWVARPRVVVTERRYIVTPRYAPPAPVGIYVGD